MYTTINVFVTFLVMAILIRYHPRWCVQTQIANRRKWLSYFEKWITVYTNLVAGLAWHDDIAIGLLSPTIMIHWGENFHHTQQTTLYILAQAITSWAKTSYHVIINITWPSLWRVTQHFLMCWYHSSRTKRKVTLIASKCVFNPPDQENLWLWAPSLPRRRHFFLFCVYA